MAEFEIHERPIDIAEALLALNPRILGFGVYIWNVAPIQEVIGTIRKVRPDITVILGGPEVSYESDSQPIVASADYVITGEADLRFAEVCRDLLSGDPPSEKIIPAPLPVFSQLQLPYDLYAAEDIAHRILYVEASRGCPFTCEFCLSSLDIPVRQVALDRFLAELEGLMDRGATQFKFVDRTFNLNIPTSQAILEFFLARHKPGSFYHFEMIPDRLPEPLRAIIARFPPGALQFEVGVQTFNEEVSTLIQRRQTNQKLAENFQFLRAHTGVHLHADLIAGLPGESIESFAAGFDRLIALKPQEIQVGILKRLRGTPIIRHDSEWQMAYSSHPPYEVLQTRLIPFAGMQRIRRFARYWDLVGNSGNFLETTPRLWSGSHSSPFHAFLRWSDWVFARIARTDQIALVHLVELLFLHLTTELGQCPKEVASSLCRDYQRPGRRDVPESLRQHLDPSMQVSALPATTKRQGPKRQARHAPRPA